MTTIVKQTAAKNIAKALRTQHTARRDLTISALFAALVHADVTYMAGMSKADAAMFDTTLRTMLPVQFKQKSGGYVFDKQKAEKVRGELGFNGSAFCADVAANVIAEHNSNKRAIMKQHYIAKASLVGLTLAEYCRRFNIRGVV